MSVTNDVQKAAKTTFRRLPWIFLGVLIGGTLFAPLIAVAFGRLAPNFFARLTGWGNRLTGQASS